MDDVPRYQPLETKYDDFLFANIGEQENGMPMSMATALTRLGLDPWDEARRLAALPASSAIPAVTHLIARVSGLTSTVSEAPKISAKLVGLLSSRDGRPAGGSKTSGALSWRIDARWVVVLLVIGLVVVASRLLFAG